MAAFSLVPYSIRLRKAGDSDQYLNLGKDFNEERIDFLEFLKCFLSQEIPSLTKYAEHLNTRRQSQPEGQQNEALDKQIFVMDDNVCQDGQLLKGRFRVGVYGYSAPLLDIQTGDIAYTKSRLEAELKPYYFLIAIKPESKVGIVLLQALNSMGIKDVFFNNLSSSFKSRYDEFVVEMAPLVPPGLVKEYLDNRIIEIRLIKFGYPSDLMDVHRDALPEEERFEGTSELIIKPPARKDFPSSFTDRIKSKIDDFLGDSDVSMNDFLEVNNFQYNNAKIKVRRENSDRTIDLINTGRLKYSEELDGKVTINTETGFPEFESIDRLAKEFLDDIKVSVWGESRT